MAEDKPVQHCKHCGDPVIAVQKLKGHAKTRHMRNGLLSCIVDRKLTGTLAQVVEPEVESEAS